MKIIITTSSFATYDRSPLDELEKNQIDYTVNPYGRKLTKDEVINLAKDADGLVAGTEPLNEDVLKQLPKLKVISRCGAGLDNVNLAKAKELRIKVFSTPYGPTLAVAELTLGLMLDLLRKITVMDRELRTGARKNEPKIWFESIETISQVLSTKNVELLKLIEKQKPQSIRELAEVSGRQVSNLSRTLKTFCKYGIVDLIEKKRTKVPVAKATSFNIEYGKNYPSFLFADDTFQAETARTNK